MVIKSHSFIVPKVHMVFELSFLFEEHKQNSSDFLFNWDGSESLKSPTGLCVNLSVCWVIWPLNTSSIGRKTFCPFYSIRSFSLYDNRWCRAPFTQYELCWCPFDTGYICSWNTLHSNFATPLVAQICGFNNSSTFAFLLCVFYLFWQYYFCPI